MESPETWRSSGKRITDFLGRDLTLQGELFFRKSKGPNKTNTAWNKNKSWTFFILNGLVCVLRRKNTLYKEVTVMRQNKIIMFCFVSCGSVFTEYHILQRFSLKLFSFSEYHIFRQRHSSTVITFGRNLHFLSSIFLRGFLYWYQILKRVIVLSTAFLRVLLFYVLYC